MRTRHLDVLVVSSNTTTARNVTLYTFGKSSAMNEALCSLTNTFSFKIVRRKTLPITGMLEKRVHVYITYLKYDLFKSVLL